ncbi:tetratricopeptide repeat protein [Simiduia aestuariiviva]|uniref:Tetratricopeptide (TPR) repeat protein n=1 Tax=Simiduia aestuariiviva TaxID=1510459 RepID=A0A839UUN2_9GAMM|nr:tetratricopeptide repeat protein [Simiduia aestuariiviva]MBB3170139.1 tetratricopeptide (TPR) repeat protein [Simiduia aestuariiviva]
MKLPSLMITLLLVAHLIGCAGQPKDDSVTPEAVVAERPQPVPMPVKDRPFTADTLYSLMVAELAGNQERFDIALANYVQQAIETRDLGVVARAARIARFLEVHRAAMEMSVLWVELEPDNNEARVLAASELAEAGRLNEAFVHAQYLLEQGNPLLLQTVAAYAGKGTDIAREQLLAGLLELRQAHGESQPLWMALALVYQQQAQLEDALAAVERAVSLEPENRQALALQARLRYQSGDQVGALRQMASLVDESPEDQRLRLQYARLLAATDLDRAADQFELLLADHPGDVDLLLSLALIRYEQQRYDAAQTLFTELLAAERRRSAAHYYLARIAQLQSDYQTALNHYLKVELGPDFMPALVQTLEILVAAKELDAAHARMAAVREKVPQQSERLYALEAEILAKYGHLDPAEAVLTQGLVQAPDSTQLLYSRALVNERRDMLELSERDLRRVIRFEPNNATALNALGYTLADRTDRYEEAYELIRQAHMLKPDDAAIVDSLGWVHYRLGNYAEALLRLREALKLYPDPEIASHLGEVLWVTGQQSEALEVWQKGISLDPQSDIIPAAMKRLGVQPTP